MLTKQSRDGSIRLVVSSIQLNDRTLDRGNPIRDCKVQENDTGRYITDDHRHNPVLGRTLCVKSKSNMHLSAVVIAGILVSCHAFMHEEVNGKQSIDIENYGTKGGKLVGFLEKLKDILKTGNPDFGIPVLDPLQMEHVNVGLNKKGVIELKGSLDNFRVDGLSSYTVNQGDFKLAGFLANISLTWNEIDLMTEYNVNGKLADLIPIYGKGSIKVQGKDLTVKVDTKLSINRERKFYVKNLSLHVHLKQLEFQITGLNNDAELSRLVSNIVSDITPQLIDDYQQQLSQTVSPLVINELNKLLKNMTLEKLIDIINGKF